MLLVPALLPCDANCIINGTILFIRLSIIIVSGNFRQGPYLSDHCCIELEVTIPKPALKRQTITSRNIKEVVTEDLVKELDLGTIEGDNVNDLVNQLEDRCKRALDTLAPEETKCITIRQKKCWLTREVLDQKKMVRRREKIW